MKTLAFLLGVVTLYQLPVLPTPWFGVLILPALILLWTVPRWMIVTSFFLGLLLALLQAHWKMAHRLPVELEGQPLAMVGKIVSIPEQKGQRVRFLFDSQEIEIEGRLKPMQVRLRLSWYEPLEALQAGDVWRLTAKLKQPSGFSNPAGFDYEAWLYRLGVGGTGYVVAKAGAEQLPADQIFSLNRVRQGTLDRIHSQLNEKPLAYALVPALSLGVRTGISDDLWRVFRVTGTSHLMAISGLHVGIVAGLFYWIGFQVWRRCVTCSTRLSAVKGAAWVALLSACAYAALAGFSVPTQRALLMLGVFMLALLAGRKVAPLRLLSMAMVLVLLVDTAAVLSPGFWLSFGAVLVIVLSMKGREGMPRWQQIVFIQLILSVALAPLTAWFFGEASLISPLANLVAVPVMTLVVVPLSLVVALLSSWGALEVAVLPALLEGILVLLHEWLFWLASLPVASISVPQFSVPLLAVCLGLILSFIVWRRYLSLVVLACIAWVLGPSVEGIEEGGMRVTFLDVGQGLSVVLETRAHALVYDLGPRFGSSFSAARSVVLPYLESRGISSLDRLVISHEDIDHRGELKGFVSDIAVDSILASHGVNDVPGIKRCRSGQTWQWDGVDFEMLHPHNDWHGNDNDSSCVLMVSAKNGTSLLLTGDITKDVESDLADKTSLDVDILQVPHHGSRTSSGAELLDATTPEHAVATLGYRNRWGFPKPEVVARYRQRQVKFHRTDHTGAVVFEVPAHTDEYRVTLWREERQRFWMPDRITD